MTAARIIHVGGSALLLALAVQAKADPGADIVMNGNDRGAVACNACHGEQGEGSPSLGYPRLSGMSKDYLVDQLEAFASGGREDPTMSPIAQALSPAERAAAAAYFEAAKAAPSPAAPSGDEAMIARGAKLARDGDWTKGLPACGQCHGPDGRGVPPAFPPLAGQSETYLKTQLEAWRQGKRRNDPLHLMTAVANKLADDEVAAAAAYYATLAPRPQDERR